MPPWSQKLYSGIFLFGGEKIKKVDDKPMVIHTKEKPKLHLLEPKKAEIKASNIYTVSRGPKVQEKRYKGQSTKKNRKMIFRRSTIHPNKPVKTKQFKGPGRIPNMPRNQSNQLSLIKEVLAFVAIIYNSPFAIFFPPLEEGDGCYFRVWRSV